MKITCDPEVDVIRILFSDAPVMVASHVLAGFLKKRHFVYLDTTTFIFLRRMTLFSNSTPC